MKDMLASLPQYQEQREKVISIHSIVGRSRYNPATILSSRFI